MEALVESEKNVFEFRLTSVLFGRGLGEVQTKAFVLLKEVLSKSSCVGTGAVLVKHGSDDARNTTQRVITVISRVT